MRDLPPPSHPGVQCPKCRWADADYSVEFTYHPAGTGFGGTSSSGDVILINGHEMPEWMLRRCRVCGYAWPEACADDPSGADPAGTDWLGLRTAAAEELAAAAGALIAECATRTVAHQSVHTRDLAGWNRLERAVKTWRSDQ